MNGSKPYGPSGDQQTSWEMPTRFAPASITFPLTPALSLGERENPPLPFGTTQRGVCPTNLPNNRTCPDSESGFPLPVGEGQGEGNRVGNPDSSHMRSKSEITSLLTRSGLIA